MFTRFKKRIHLFVISCFISSTLFAQLKLPAVFSDNMVFQQKAEIKIWGWANPGEMVQVKTGWNKRSYQATAKQDGSWEIQARTQSYGGPYQVKVNTSTQKIELKNVLIGDVWICSGQSNMEMPLAGWGKIMNYETEIVNANYPEIRLIQLEHVTSNVPLNNIKINNGGMWRVCSPESIPDFSATAYFFAREVYKKTKIPIGLIHTSWGGTIAEAWTSGSSLKKMPDFVNAVKKIEDITKNKDAIPYRKKLEDWMAKVLLADKGFSNGSPVWTDDKVNDWKAMPISRLWEESVLPDFDGIVWLKRVVELPESMLGSDLKLSLGMIDDNDITYFNGQQIGEMQGYNQNRNYTIPANLLRAGKNTVTIRVFDNGGGGGMYSPASDLYLQNLSGNKISLAQNWKYNVGLDFKEFEPAPVSDESANRPTVLYNAMIHPLIKFKIKGAIWYQGESNVGRADQYKTLFSLLIKDWREKWNQGDFPFYFVQLANFLKSESEPVPSDWAELRDAQKNALILPNTGMATIIDIGNPEDIHPKNKQEVGRRLALIALNKLYGKSNEYSGPVLKSTQIKKDKVILTFDHAKGLVAKGDDLKGFALAASNGKFYWAKAEIQRNKVIVTSPNVVTPVTLSYSWANNPNGNLVNSSGFPASPFKTKVSE